MLAAAKISRLAVADPSVRPVGTTYPVSPALVQDERMDEALPLGSRGGTLVHHHFPADGEYELSIRLQRVSGGSDTIRGIGEPHDIDVRVDRERVALFTIGGRYPAVDPYGSAAGRTDSDLAERMEYQRNADAALAVRFFATAGTKAVGVAFRAAPLTMPEGVFQPRPPVTSFEYASRAAQPAVDSIQILGPYQPRATGERLPAFVCRPATEAEEEPCARLILGAIARRAFRRPVTARDIGELLPFYAEGRAGGSFERGVALALERILIDPEFLFRVERDPDGAMPGRPAPLSDLELASRLSFFLWSSLPDDELLDVAANGRLRLPAVLRQQVARMLADSRAKALVTNFAGQWLFLRNLRA
ncbi:MAG: DUF1592 domain-containing protein, partial [Acidimicrobiia bacterium]|nr:DUF1592 domain-containing protein [Acidimicrobiia bacterium]